MKISYATAACFALAAKVFAGPQITSWLTLDSGKFAQIFHAAAEKNSGPTDTTCSHGRQVPPQPAAKLA